MHFDRKGFLEHLQYLLRVEEFDVYAHRTYLYIVSFNPYFSLSLCREMIEEALIGSLQDRDGARTAAEERSLFETPGEAYLDALRGALHGAGNLVKKGRINTERGEAIEYRVNLTDLQSLVIHTRLDQDVQMVKSLLSEELLLSDYPSLSYRFIEKRIFHRTGRAWSTRRIQQVYEKLKTDRKIRLNGNRFTKGANIL